MSNDKIKKQHHDKKLTKAQAKELIKCASDVEYFIKNYVFIQHPTKGAILFNLYPYQERVVSDLQQYEKNIILQPRQSGKTAGIVAYLLHKAIFTPDVTIGVAAHKGDGAKEIIGRFKYAYENLPFWMKPAVKSYNVFDVVFDNGSKIMSETTTESTYRGKSLTILYLDEFAFVKPSIATEFWKSILPTLSAPGTEFIITSTPNTSEGKYAELWFKAEQGLNEFNPIRVYNEEVPGRDDEFKRKTLLDMTELEYAQEYECAFVSNKGTLIQSSILEALRPSEAIRQVDDLMMYRDIEGRRIGMSMDVGTGTGQDFTVVQLFDLDTFEQVGEYRNNTLNLTDVTKRFINLLKFVQDEGATHISYTIESNSIGQGVIQLLNNAENPILNQCDMVSEIKRLGILTTNKSKLKGCSKFKDLLESERLKIHSKNLISELKFFVKAGVTFKAESGKTDDLVMGCVLFCLMADEMATYDTEVYDRLNSSSLIGELSDDMYSDDPMPFVF